MIQSTRKQERLFGPKEKKTALTNSRIFSLKNCEHSEQQ